MNIGLQNSGSDSTEGRNSVREWDSENVSKLLLTFLLSFFICRYLLKHLDVGMEGTQGRRWELRVRNVSKPLLTLLLFFNCRYFLPEHFRPQINGNVTYVALEASLDLC